MASSEREDIPDLPLNCAHERTPESLQPLMVTQHAAGPNADLSHHVESQTLFLSRSKLNGIMESTLRNRMLKNLYLEGNQICNIPDLMFPSLPNLVWLDLRNNLIESLPAGIGSHRCLRTLLLEGNPISELPPELGNVLTLKGLNLRNCPIRSPPQDIVHQGLECILQYLRSVMAKRPVSVQRSHPDVPPVEKLQLSELVKSSVTSCGDEEEEGEKPELQRFRELKHKMILQDRAELGHRSSRTTRPHGHLPVVKRKKVLKFRNPVSLTSSRSEKRTTAARKELKERQDILEQRKKDQELLQKWRTNAKIMHKAARLEQERQDNQMREVTRLALIVGSGRGTGAGCKGSDPSVAADTNSTQWTQMASGRLKEQDEARTALEKRLRKHVQMMQERHRKPTGTVEEEKATPEQDMRETLKQDKREKEYRFTAFTGDILPACPPNN